MTVILLVSGLLKFHLILNPIQSLESLLKFLCPSLRTSAFYMVL